MENSTSHNQRAKSLVGQVEGSVSLRLVQPDGKPLGHWMPSTQTDMRPSSGPIWQYSFVADSGGSSTRRISVMRGDGEVGGSEETYSLVMVAGEPETWGQKNRLGPDQGERALFLAGGLVTTLKHSMVRKAERNSSVSQLKYRGRSGKPMALVGGLPRPGIGDVHMVSRSGQGHHDLANVVDVAPVGSLTYRSWPEGVAAAGGEYCGTLKVSEPFLSDRFASLTTTGFGAIDNVGEGIKFQIEPKDGDVC